MEKYIYGINPILEALSADNSKITEIIISKNVENKRKNKIISISSEKNIPVRYKEKADLDISYGGNHQGVVAVMSHFKYAELNELLSMTKDKPHAKLLFIDCVEDPRNLGALIRSAAAFGFDGIVIQDKRSASVTASVVKASAGAIFHIQVCLVNNLNNALERVRDSGFWSIGTAIDAEKYIHELDMDMKIALIIGNEQKGIRKLVAKNCDFLVKIPISKKIDSLNASAAGACTMYEIARQQMEAQTSPD